MRPDLETEDAKNNICSEIEKIKKKALSDIEEIKKKAGSQIKEVKIQANIDIRKAKNKKDEDLEVNQNKNIEEISHTSENAIWNPNAVANWSLPFSVVFGTYLHALNWKALGEEKLAIKAKIWFYISLFIALFVPIILSATPGLTEEVFHRLSRWILFTLLLMWYFSNGKKQGKYVKEKLNNNYPRRRWKEPLIAGILIYIGYGLYIIILFSFIPYILS